MKKLWISMMVAAMAVAAVHADVYIVRADDKDGAPAEEAAMISFLNANFTGAELGTIYAENYETTQPAAVAGDLVIILRSIGAGDYDNSNAEITAWNSLVAGILCFSPYFPDSDRLGWSTTGAQGYTTSPTNSVAFPTAGAETLVTADSLFDGVDTNTVPGYADLITDGIYYRAHADGVYDTVSGADVLGEDTASSKMVLARIVAGTAWDSSAFPSTSGNHSGNRIVFHYAVEGNALDADLTDDGQLVLSNAVAELLIPPSSVPVFTSDPINKPAAYADAVYSNSIAGDVLNVSGSTLTFTKEGGPAWLNVATNGVLSGIPGVSDAGFTNVFTVQLTDGDDTDTATLNIEVLINQAPSFTSDPIIANSAVDGIAYTNSIAGMASDPESDELTFSLVGPSTWLSVSTNGVVTGTPGGSDLGLNEFTVQVDATGGSDTATLNISVYDSTAGSILEAEDAFFTNATAKSSNAGFTGSGYVDYQGDTTDCYVEWTVVVTDAGIYDLVFRYAVSGPAEGRPLDILVNDVEEEALKDFPDTGSWTNWELTSPLTVALNAGTNTVQALSAAGSGFTGGNLDHLAIYLQSTPGNIAGSTILANGLMRLEISGATPAASYYPESTLSLVGETWEAVPHSDDGVNPFIVTDLSYSTTDGTNKFIYMQTTNSAEFFRIVD